MLCVNSERTFSMKKVITLLFLLMCMILNAQQAKHKDSVQTTTEEYDFLTKEYNHKNSFKVLDGYIIYPFRLSQDDEMICKYQFFVEKKTKNLKAILIILEEKGKKHNKIDYLCIPINNQELLDRFVDDHYKIKFSKADFLESSSYRILRDNLPSIFTNNIDTVRTTPEEYNYLTQAYNISNKSNVLFGYELVPLTSVVLKENYRCDFQLFVEAKSQNVKALLQINKKLKKDEDKILIDCLPFNNHELYVDYFNSIRNLGLNLAYYHNLSITIISSRVLMKIYYDQINEK